MASADKEVKKIVENLKNYQVSGAGHLHVFRLLNGPLGSGDKSLCSFDFAEVRSYLESPIVAIY